MAPGAGDEIQAIKAGVLEIADVIAVTKADLPSAARLGAQLRALATRADGAAPTVVLTSSTTGEGIAELAEALDAAPRTRVAAVTPEFVAADVLRAALAELHRQFAADEELGRLSRLVVTGEMSKDEAAAALLARLRGSTPSVG